MQTMGVQIISSMLFDLFGDAGIKVGVFILWSLQNWLCLTKSSLLAFSRDGQTGYYVL